jgi:hypothetical protein
LVNKKFIFHYEDQHNVTDNKKERDWWGAINSVVIWASIIFIFYLVVQTSYDYSKSPATFSLFSQNQLFMLGFITVLLLFKYISKLKIGNIIDIEFKNLEDHVKNTLQKVDVSLNAGTALAVPDLNSIKEELLLATGNIENIKVRAQKI